MSYIVISSQGEEIATQNLRGTVHLGRSPESDISVHDHLMSRMHCRLHDPGTGWTIVDLESRNGTFVNGRRVMRRELQDGDELLVGSTTVIYREGLAPALRAGGRPELTRPADPHEALAGTVMALEMPQSPSPELQRLAGRPVPRPAPLAPAAYESEGVGTLVLDMLSDLHDTQIMQSPTRPARRAKPRPIVRDLRVTQSAVQTRSKLRPQSAVGSSQSVISRSRPAIAPQRTLKTIAPLAAARRRRRASHASLDVFMALLLVGLIAIALLATRALFLMT